MREVIRLGTELVGRIVVDETKNVEVESVDRCIYPPSLSPLVGIV